MGLEFDFVVIGAGSSGCAVTFGLAQKNAGTIGVLEAGPTNAVPQVKIPFGLAYTRGSKRDWQFLSTPQTALGGRRINVTRGKMLGGSSSINSMVWFRGRRDDFDNWQVPGWSGADVEADFEAIEERLAPRRFANPHPTSEAFALSLGDNGHAPPTPEREGAGVFHLNLHDGARWSAADGLLEPAKKTGNVSVVTGANVDCIEFENGDARTVHLTDGRIVTARRGVILSAGSIGSPSILMRSGIGPAQHLRDLGIEVQSDSPRVGQNLHDHPAVGLHMRGPNSGYGLALNQFPHWAISPFNWLLRREGRLTSNIVESGAFFRASPIEGDGDDRPDCQSHFIPFNVGYKGYFITWGSGYSADVNVCRPFSRGQLTLSSSDPNEQPQVDLGLLTDQRDVEILKYGVKKLRTMLDRAPFESHRASEVYPGRDVQSDEGIEEFVRDRCATAYHPVGTLTMGEGDAPVSPELAVNGVGGLWVADASIMPAVTSANTNAPSMMIGYRAAGMILNSLENGK